jgi:hypothetical protein
MLSLWLELERSDVSLSSTLTEKLGKDTGYLLGITRGEASRLSSRSKP